MNLNEFYKKDLILINSEDNDIVKLKKYDDFFNKLDVSGLGRGNIQRIIEMPDSKLFLKF